MAFTVTSLAAAFAADSLSLNATAATGSTVGGIVKVEDELMVITAISGTKITVRSRGDLGGKAVAHASGASCVFGLASDLPDYGPQGSQGQLPQRTVTYYSAAGAITVPTRDAVAVIGVGATGAHAMTLADPSAGTDGVLQFIVSKSAQAHTVTLTTGYGGSNATDVFTFSGAIGDSITLMSLNGAWCHVATGLVAADTVSAAVA